MRFSQLDRITELHPGVRIAAEKTLLADENYLQDHFPRFPVMPGVLMLEAMYQAAAWLARRSENFANTVVVLKEARAVKFYDFVAPGQTLVVTAEIAKWEEQTASFKSQGTVEGRLAVGARLVLDRYCIGERYPHRGVTDDYARRELRKVFDRLWPAAASVAKVD
jgi:3-hydroxyacyl-[acyl-carrier-protein] dehydratase